MKRFGAEQIGVGVRDPDSVMELWVSQSNGEWSLVMSYDSGNSCIVAMGETWIPMDPPDDPA